MKEHNLDSIDLKILDALQRDARLSFRKLAENIGLSPTPVLQRVKRLEYSGYIEHYRAVLNPERIGLGMLAFVEIALSKTTVNVFEKFDRAIKDMDSVLECHMVAGGFDYILKARVKDMDAYRQLLQQLAAIDGIDQTHTYVVMQEVKNESRLPLRGVV